MLNPTSTPDKSIEYDPSTRDYALYLYGDFIGSARTYQEGETTLDALLAEQAHDAAVLDTDDEAEMEALVAEIIAEHSDLADYPPISEDEAVIVALGMRRALWAYRSKWDDMAAWAWSAGCCAREAA